jgi:hypothetical protein
MVVVYSGFTRSWNQVKQNQLENIISEGDDLFFYTTTEPEIHLPYRWKELGPQLLEHDPKYKNNAAGETSIINTINQWRNRRDAFGLVNPGSNVYAIARTDTGFTGKIDFTITPGIVYIPEGQDYGGFNDQFAFGDYGAMKYYSELYEYFDQYWNDGVRFHPETMLRHHLRNTMVIRVPQQTQIVRL